MIPASKLKNLGLINDFYNEAEFVEQTKTQASEICNVGLNVVLCTKKLLNQYQNGLNEYLDLESTFMMR